jgi:hypothetical protein
MEDSLSLQGSATFQITFHAVQSRALMRIRRR